MFAIRLVQLIETHADPLSEGLIRKLENSPRCSDLFQKVPGDELRRRAYEIYRNLNDWIQNKTESEIEERYIGLGVRRARQGVAFSHVFWAISSTKEYLWDYLEGQGMMEPVELLGERELLRRLDEFFDRALYFTAVGYESVYEERHKHELAHAAHR